MTSPTSVRLPSELHAKIVAVANAERRSVNAQIVRILERAFDGDGLVEEQAETEPVSVASGGQARAVGSARSSTKSSKAKAKNKRTEMCEHRRAPDEFCPRCDK